MKKQVSKLALGIALMAAVPSFAQQPVIRPCDTYAAMEQVFAADPQAKARYELAEATIRKQMEENPASNGKSSVPVYTVPVVFHVLHIGGSENITDAQCIAALDWVNKDYARLHADAATTASPFEPLYIDSEIRFMLAHKDPMGNPTTGIVHKYDTRTNWDRNNNSASTLFAGITWNPTKYLNVIIVKDIIAAPGQQGVVVGYTYKPGTWATGANPDAIVYNHGYLAGGNARSLSHEVGHWLSLSHTWGDTNNPGVSCGDDGVTDTPPTKGNLFTCPSSFSGNNCAGSGGQDNVENIMDYSSCPKNFTQGQTTKMRNALTSAVSNRQNLWQTSNLIATDVDGTGPCCAPIAEFLSDKNSYTVCAGGSLLMKNFSYNGTPTSITWSADNGATISSPTNPNTNIVFPTVGISNVTLTVSNSLGISTQVRPVTVVDQTPGMVGPVVESFENLGLPVNWSIDNKNSGSPTWEQVLPTKPYHGMASFYLPNTNAGANHVDVLETPIIDMQASPEKKMSFAYAYARRSSTHSANLKITASTDCRGTWSDLLSLDAAQMQQASGGVMAFDFEPVTESEWKVVEFSSYPNSAANWAGIKNSPNLILRFTFTEVTGGGNHFYLDAINLPGPLTGINALTRTHALGLQPNPSSGETKLTFTLHQPSNVKVNVVNLLGAEVMKLADSQMKEGEREVSFNTDDSLTPGVYFVNVSVNGSVMTRKLIVE
jgi:hypothetical protein